MIAVDADERPKDPVILQEQFREALSRIDRREAIGRRFGVSPTSGRRSAAAAAAAPVAAASIATTAPDLDTAAPASVSHMPRRTISWKPLALAATLIAIGAIGALVVTKTVNSGRLVGSPDPSEPIGVPIGVPESSTATTVANTSNVPIHPPASTTAPQVASTGSAPAAAPTQPVAPATSSDAGTVATNTATAAPADGPSSGWKSSIVSADQAAPAAPQPAAQAPAPAQTPPPTVVAANTAPATAAESEGASPAEGPVDVAAAQASAPAPPQPAVADASTKSNAQPATAGQPSPAKPSTTAQRKAASTETAAAAPSKSTTAAAKPAKNKPKREEQPARVAEPVEVEDAAEEALPPVPKGSRRAKYVGTRPDGSMVFTLPSSERVYAAPPAGPLEPAPRRRLRQLLNPAPAPADVPATEIVDPEEEPVDDEAEIEDEE